MKKLSLFLSAMLISLMSFAGTVTFEVGQDKLEGHTQGNPAVLTKDGVTLDVSKGAFGRDDNFRVYAGYGMTISCEYGNITGVEITCTAAAGGTQYGPDFFTTSVGTYTYADKVGTWTGDEASVAFSATKQVRFTKLVVTYASSDANFVSQPMITGDINFADTANVVITADEGMKIYYTLDGTDPTTASTEYTTPFEVYATTTVKAIAYNETTAASSMISEAIFTQATKVPCAQAAAIAKALSDNVETTELYYNVKGYVTSLKDEFNATSNKQQFWIADTKTGGEVLYAYNNQVPCAMEVGMKVRIVGKLKQWNTGQYIQPQIVNAEVTVLAPAPKVYTVSASAENGTVEGAGQYEEGAQATLTATAAEGYEFVNWTVDGTEVSTENPYTFNVTADVALVANFKEAAAVTTKKETSTCPAGTLVDGKVIHELECCTIVQEKGEATKDLKAASPWILPLKSIMTITPKPGVAIEEFIITCTSTTLGNMLRKSTVTNATAVGSNNPVEYHVTNPTEPVVFTLAGADENKFKQIDFTYTVAGSTEPEPVKYTVTVKAENGTVEGAGEYIENAEATLTATPAEGYEFVNWTVDGTEVSTENPYTFNVTADVALVANFKKAAAVTTKEELYTCNPGTLADGKVTHDLPCCVIVQEQGESTTALKSTTPWQAPAKSLMTITPKEGVTILKYVINTKNTTLGTYLGKSELTNATKTATNNGLVTFTVTNGTEPVVMKFVSTTIKFYEITFTYTVAGSTEPEPVKYTVTVKAENGTVEGAGEYIENAEATLTATPAEGYEFVNWTVADSVVSTENPYKFNVTADVEVVANFKEAAPATETVYFINAKKWAKVNVYAWTTDPNASWPGAAATKEAEQIAGYDVYSFTANAGQYANVIFNDGSSQTPDLVWTAGKYYVIDMGWLTKEEAESKLAAPLPETWNIVGAAGLMGTDWNLNDAKNAMTLQADGTYLLEKKGITIVAGSYEYKAAKDHGWTVAVPQDGNQTLKITTSGIYDVTFVLDVTAKQLTATATLKQAAVVIPTVVIAGDMNSWSQTKDKFTMSADSLTATFKTTLAAKSYGFKMIVGGAWHSDGKTVTRDANSTKFTGANSNTNSTLKADIAGEYLFTWEYATKTLTVTYPALPVKYNVTVTAENGTVEGAGEYEEGKTATLTATPAEGYNFVNWTVADSIVSTENPYKFTVTADIALVANFEKIPATKYNVTVTAENGTVEGAGEYEEGAEATLTATANEGYNFVNWTVADSVVSTENPYKFVVTADVALVANFEKIPAKPTVVTEMVGVVKRALQNGENTIVLTHEANGAAHIYELANGTILELVQEGVIARDPENAGDLLAISDIAVTEDGKLVATNYMITQSDDAQVAAGDKRGETRIYIWNDLHDAPSILFTSKMSSNWFQSKQGLTMAVKGTSDNMEIFMTGIHKSKAWARVSSYRVIDGVYVEPDGNHNDHYFFYDINDAIALETTVGTEYELNASPLGAMNWILDANLINPIEIVEPEINNVEIATSVALTEDLGKKYNGATYLTIGEQAIMVAPNANAEGLLAGVKVLDITAGLASAKEVAVVDLETAVEATAAATAVAVAEDTLTITLVADATVYTLTAVLVEEKPEPEIWTVAGAPASIFGTEWDPANTANNMTLQADGTYKWEKTDLTLAASHIQFKIAKNNKWDEAYPADNYDLAINEAGIYTITIIFNATSKEVTATATKTGDATVIPTIAIAGEMNGWNTTANEFVVSADELTATLTLNLEAKEYGFKMFVAGVWTSDGAKVTRENNTIVFTGANAGNSTLVADVAGEYTFTWTYATSTLAVTYPVASNLENAIVAEQPVKIVRNGQVFILKGDKMFNTMGQQVK